MNSAARAARLREILSQHFAPLELLIEDQSHHHIGHAGAAGGLGHFKVRIVAEAFRGHSALERHRLVYAAVGNLMKSDIHALIIEARAP